MKFVQRFIAVNDRNGNPRRLFMVYSITPRKVVLERVILEGYAGQPAGLRRMKQLADTHILVHHFKEVLKSAREQGILN